jgi:3-hydroxyisobutyrate dehydrogenase-like beta-hydroxyacid dehydrogenase
MVASLVATGHEVRFFARRPEVVADVGGLGATPMSSIAAVGEASDVVIICVFSDDQVVAVGLGPGGLIDAMAHGSTLINHTTGSPSTAARLAAAGTARGVRFLDAALSGAASAVAARALTLLVGGDEAVLADVRSVLASYSDPILHVGAVGDGQRIKLVNNALFAAHIVLTGEAERVASELGVPPATALAAITRCSGDSAALRTVVGLGSTARTWELAGPFVRKDIAMVQEVASEMHVELGLLGVVASAHPNR